MILIIYSSFRGLLNNSHGTEKLLCRHLCLRAIHLQFRQKEVTTISFYPSINTIFGSVTQLVLLLVYVSIHESWLDAP